jgi:hypothetical protein
MAVTARSRTSFPPATQSGEHNASERDATPAKMRQALAMLQFDPARRAPAPQTSCSEIARSDSSSCSRLAADLGSACNGSAADRPPKNHASAQISPKKSATCEVLDHTIKDRDSL